MSVCPSIYPSSRLCMSVYSPVCICLSAHLSVFCLSFCPSIYLSTCLCMSVCLSIRPFICPPDCLSSCQLVQPSIRPSICQSVCPPICLSIYSKLQNLFLFSFSIVHGAWTSWSAWSTCSASCDTGVAHRNRSCTNPAPTRGGLECKGEKRTAKKCFITACEGK